jgi:hypothetical protein
MIRSLRQRHRLMIIALAIALIALFVSALVVRRPIPTINRIPEGWQKGGAR